MMMKFSFIVILFCSSLVFGQKSEGDSVYVKIIECGNGPITAAKIDLSKLENPDSLNCSLVVNVKDQNWGGLITDGCVYLDLINLTNDHFINRFDLEGKGTLKLDSIDCDSKYRFEAYGYYGLGNRGEVDCSKKSSPIEFVIDLYLIDGGKPIKFSPIYFDLNSSVVEGKTKDSLDYLRMVLEENPTITITIDIFKYKDEKEQIISQRIKAIQKFLISKGIAKERFRFFQFWNESDETYREFGNVWIDGWDYMPENEK